jgi:hypothetical protein
MFFHRSSSSGFDSDNFGYGNYLSFLGKRVLGMVVMDVKFKRWVMLGFVELEISTTTA